MSIAYTECAAEVAANLEIDASLPADLTRFKVVEHLNQAQNNLINILHSDELFSLIKNLQMDLTAATVTYTWPNGSLYSSAAIFMRFLDLYISYDAAIASGVPGKQATIYDRKYHIRPIQDLATKDYPFVDINKSGGLEIAPTPATTRSPGMVLNYIGKPTQFATSGPVDSDLPYKFKNLVVYLATSLSCMVDNYRPDMSKMFYGYYKDELANFKLKDDSIQDV